MATMAKDVSEGVTGAVEAVKSWPQRAKNYVEGLRMEMRRVTWPSKAQVQATTVVVLVTVFVFGVYFAIVDWVLNLGMTRMLNYFTR
jgi:preprotein translocase subunit SecE